MGRWVDLRSCEFENLVQQMFFKDRYGAIPFGIFLMLAIWAPTMTLLFCVTHAALLIVAGVTTWRRTHLPFAASSMFMGAAAFVAIAWQAGLQQTFADVLQTWLWPFVAWTILGAVVMYLEPLVHREKWGAWKRHMEGMSFGEMLLMRHIPHLQ